MSKAAQEAGAPMGTLSYVDYRYTRFVLDPRTRKFVMLRYVFFLSLQAGGLICVVGIGEIVHGLTYPSWALVWLHLLVPSAPVHSAQTKLTLRQKAQSRSLSTRYIHQPPYPHHTLAPYSNASTPYLGPPPVLRLSSSKHRPLVSRRLLLLCILHCSYLCA